MHYGSSKLLKSFRKSTFHYNFRPQLWIFQNKLNSPFQLICITPWSSMKLERIKNSFEAKLRYHFPKNVKFPFSSVLWVIFFLFHQQFSCKIYVWRWCASNLVFFVVISITDFSDKKNWNFKYLSKCQQSVLLLQLVWILTPKKFWKKCCKCFIFA